MFKNETFGKLFFGILLTMTGFFSAQTFLSIKTLEKEVISIRIKLAEFEAKRIDRDEIRQLISEYHNSHPFNKKEEQ